MNHPQPLQCLCFAGAGLLAEEAKVKLVQECFSIQPVKESIFMPVKCSPGGQLSAVDDRG